MGTSRSAQGTEMLGDPPQRYQHGVPPQPCLPPALSTEPIPLATGSIRNSWNRGCMILGLPTVSFASVTPSQGPPHTPQGDGSFDLAASWGLGWGPDLNPPHPSFCCLRNPAPKFMDRRVGEQVPNRGILLTKTPPPHPQPGGTRSLLDPRVKSREGIWGHGAHSQCPRTAAPTG